MALAPLPDILIEPIVRAALTEDLGRAGDVTSAATVPAGLTARVALRARAAGVVAGLQPARLAFRLIDPAVKIAVVTGDGGEVAPGGVIAHLEGPARSLLTAERVALNFLVHLSGVATATATYRAAIRAAGEGLKAKIVCTRKTMPLLRALEKHAVLAGGGANHRFGLDDAILIKDNHIAAAGGVASALARAKAAVSHMMRIEIEVDTLEQLDEALAAGAEIILLDNMPPAMLSEAVQRTAGRAILEASGGVTLETVGAIARTGVDYISSGALTHSVKGLDIGLDFETAV